MNTRHFSRAVVAVATAAVSLVVAPLGTSSQQSGTTYLDNGRVRVGIDLDEGGKIAFLAPASRPRSGTNLVFQSVQSYYRSWPGQAHYWHGTNAGGEVLTSRNDGRTIYTKSIAPLCECTLEQWVSIDGGAVRVRNRLTNFLSDVAKFQGLPQELPALYTRGTAYRLVTYAGSAPYTNRRLREFTQADGGELFSRPGPSFQATEHWAALVGADDFGVGLVEPERTLFTGVAGVPGVSPENVNGYLTASTPEILDANVTYTYSYALVVGSIADIRAYAYARRPDPRPDYRFVVDRQGWSYVGTHDRGFPISGALRVEVGDDDSSLVGPDGWWRAAQVPRLYIRGRWRTEQDVAEVLWRAPGRDFSASRRRQLDVDNDGRFHTYRVDLFRSGTYRGTIGGLRLDPIDRGEPNGQVDITCISWKPCPIDRKAEARLVDNDRVPYLDDFSAGVDGSFWWVGRSGVGPTVAAVDERVELTVPAGAAPDPGQTWISANLQSHCRIRGDFDVQVDFRLLDWPAANGVHVDLAVGDERALVRLNTFREEAVAWFPPQVSGLEQDELSGSFRIRRRGELIYGYVLGRGGWFELSRAGYDEPLAYLRIGIGANPTEFGGENVRVAFDNVRISSGRLVC